MKKNLTNDKTQVEPAVQAEKEQPAEAENPKEPKLKNRFAPLWIFLFVIVVFLVINEFLLNPVLAWIQSLWQ